MSGFIFDAMAARAAIAARGPMVTVAAVSAVLAVEGRAMARKPQEPRAASHSGLQSLNRKNRKNRKGRQIPPAQCLPTKLRNGSRWRPITSQRFILAHGGRFFDQWGSLAVEFPWLPADLFDVPRDGRPGGLAWFSIVKRWGLSGWNTKSHPRAASCS
jgi:hypothetical protein